jgi:protein-tyrosine-phosphatase
MILPAALVLLSVIFMIVTMVLASRRFAGWKSSALPNFYHGFTAWDVPEPYRGDIEDMQRSAREIYARLATDEEGRARLMRTDG